MSSDLLQLRPLGLSESLPAVPGGRVEESDLTTSGWRKAEVWQSKRQKSNPHNDPFGIFSSQDLATQGQRSKNAEKHRIYTSIYMLSNFFERHFAVHQNVCHLLLLSPCIPSFPLISLMQCSASCRNTQGLGAQDIPRPHAA